MTNNKNQIESSFEKFEKETELLQNIRNLSKIFDKHQQNPPSLTQIFLQKSLEYDFIPISRSGFWFDIEPSIRRNLTEEEMDPKLSLGSRIKYIFDVLADLVDLNHFGVFVARNSIFDRHRIVVRCTFRGRISFKYLKLNFKEKLRIESLHYRSNSIFFNTNRTGWSEKVEIIFSTYGINILNSLENNPKFSLAYSVSGFCGKWKVICGKAFEKSALQNPEEIEANMVSLFAVWLEYHYPQVEDG